MTAALSASKTAVQSATRTAILRAGQLAPWTGRTMEGTRDSKRVGLMASIAVAMSVAEMVLQTAVKTADSKGFVTAGNWDRPTVLKTGLKWAEREAAWWDFGKVVKKVAVKAE